VLSRFVGKRLTYANVVATLALFLALSGGVVWAAGKIGTRKLKTNSVTAGKIKANAVTAGKIKANAVTYAKIKDGAVGFAKLAIGANLVGTASSSAVAANSVTPTSVPLSGTTSFTSQSGTLNLLSVEAKGENLARAGEQECSVAVIPFVNGSKWGAANGALTLHAFAPDAEQPTGQVPVAGFSGPIGLAAPGTSQTVSIKVVGSPNCTASSSVTVAIAVTQAK